MALSALTTDLVDLSFIFLMISFRLHLSVSTSRQPFPFFPETTVSISQCPCSLLFASSGLSLMLLAVVFFNDSVRFWSDFSNQIYIQSANMVYATDNSYYVHKIMYYTLKIENIHKNCIMCCKKLSKTRYFMKNYYGFL